MHPVKLGMVIAAGGAGTRFSGSQNKLLAEYRGEAVLLHSLRTFVPIVERGYFVVAAPAQLLDSMRAMTDAALPGNGVLWCTGGATRVASVVCGVKMLPEDAELIAIHDAARPLATAELLARLCEAAATAGGAVPGMTPVDTIKVVDARGVVIAGPVRKTLAAVATPQVFQGQAYRAALTALPEAIRMGRMEDAELTDDAAIFMRAGGCVKVVFDQAPNPKITVAGDIAGLAALQAGEPPLQEN